MTPFAWTIMRTIYWGKDRDDEREPLKHANHSKNHFTDLKFTIVLMRPPRPDNIFLAPPRYREEVATHGRR